MRLATCIAAALAAFIATPASAQALPGILADAAMEARDAHNARLQAACEAGQVPTMSETIDARVGATAALQRYVQLAAAHAPADATAAYTRDKGLRVWTRNGARGEVAAVDDPLARRLAARGFTLPDPDSFYRSSDGYAALGVWRIDGDSGQAGYYRVLFHRRRASWSIENLELSEGTADPAPARPFCHVPDDVNAWTDVP